MMGEGREPRILFGGGRGGGRTSIEGEACAQDICLAVLVSVWVVSESAPLVAVLAYVVSVSPAESEY